MVGLVIVQARVNEHGRPPDVIVHDAYERMRTPSGGAMSRVCAGTLTVVDAVQVNDVAELAGSPVRPAPSR